MDTCSTCKYWLPLPSGLGRCHRNPPVNTGVFPMTRSGDFCGQHETKDVSGFNTPDAVWIPSVLSVEPSTKSATNSHELVVPPALAAAREWHAGKVYTCNPRESEKDVLERVEKQAQQLAAIIQRHFEPLYAKIQEWQSVDTTATDVLVNHPRYTGAEKP